MVVHKENRGRRRVSDVLLFVIISNKKINGGSKSVSVRALSCFVRYVEVMMSLYNDI